MQPGMPQGFGTIGPDATPIFTLPGNPVSAFVSFEVFVRPVLRRMLGSDHPYRHMVRAALTEPLSVTAGEAPVRPRPGWRSRSGAYVVTPVGGQGSHLVADLAHANCLRGDRRRRHRGRRGLRRVGDDAGAASGMSSEFTHLDASGAARMVDVSGKEITVRQARASGKVLVSAEVVAPAPRRRACPRATRSRWPGSPASRPPSARPTSSRSATRSRSTG